MEYGERPRPFGRVSNVQRWQRLLFMHWRIADDVLRPLVPASLDIDHFAGQAFIGLVAFHVVELRAPFGPPQVCLRFLETNVRTYVRLPAGQPGVYFMSLDAGSLLAVLGARVITGLPYFWATGHEIVDANRVEYRLVRRVAPPALADQLHPPGVHISYTIGGSLGSARPGTLEHFLVERYSLHLQRGNGLWSIDIRHQPYPLHSVQISSVDESLLRAAGVPRLAPWPDHVAFASGVDVEIGLPRVRRIR